MKKRRRERTSKGVDVTLTTLMLSHAFRNNYDVAVLVTGDGDFGPAVREVRRGGKAVHLWFVPSVAPSLKLQCDAFSNLAGR